MKLITRKQLKIYVLSAFLAVAGFQNQFAQDTIPSFPGAEGFGKYVSGGRGGDVVEVTTLEDMNRYGVIASGSLREAVQTPGNAPITIVFRVSGTIELAADLEVSRSNVTIAGQTAPGDGICIKNFSFVVNGENIIVRYMRFRPGDKKRSEVSCLRFENTRQIMIDHCSMSWSIEENMGNYDNDSTTVQWCILSESLYDSYHAKGPRGYAAQWGGEWASYHHNLLAHHNSRSPRFNGCTSNDYFAIQDFVNNVIYDYGHSGSLYGGETEISIDTNADGVNDAKNKINFAYNYLKPGPEYSGSYFLEPYHHRETQSATGYTEWYIEHNIIHGHPTTTANNWSGVDAGNVGGESNIRVNTPHKVDSVSTQSADSAYKLVLANAGAILPIRDAVDTRVVNSVIDRTGSIIDSQDEVGGWPTLETPPTDSIPTDTDKDGIPDYWEDENSLDKTNPDDGKIITEDGYSNLEHYLNSDIPYINPRAVSFNGTTYQEIDLFPNPVNDILSISSDIQLKNIEIYSPCGSLMLSKASNSNSIDVSSLESGIYFVKVISMDNLMYTQKVVKQ